MNERRTRENDEVKNFSCVGGPQSFFYSQTSHAHCDDDGPNQKDRSQNENHSEIGEKNRELTDDVFCH